MKYSTIAYPLGHWPSSVLPGAGRRHGAVSRPKTGSLRDEQPFLPRPEKLEKSDDGTYPSADQGTYARLPGAG